MEGEQEEQKRQGLAVGESRGECERWIEEFVAEKGAGRREEGWGSWEFGRGAEEGMEGKLESGRAGRRWGGRRGRGW